MDPVCYFVFVISELVSTISFHIPCAYTVNWLVTEKAICLKKRKTNICCVCPNSLPLVTTHLMPWASNTDAAHKVKQQRPCLSLCISWLLRLPQIKKVLMTEMVSVNQLWWFGPAEKNTCLSSRFELGTMFHVRWRRWQWLVKNVHHAGPVYFVFVLHTYTGP